MYKIKFSDYPNSKELAEFLGERSENTRKFLLKILGRKVYMSGFIGAYMAASESKAPWSRKRYQAERRFFHMVEMGWIDGVIDAGLVRRCERVVNKAKKMEVV